MGFAVEALKTLAEKRSDMIVFVGTVDIPQVTLMPMNAVRRERKLESAFYEAVEKLVSSHRNVVFFELKKIIEDMGRKAFYDHKMRYLGGMPFSVAALRRLGEEIELCLDAYRGKRRKVLTVDLDNTIWNGVVGEDGPTGIKLAPEKSGMPYTELQCRIKELKEMGILLTVLSKNNPAEVDEVFKAGGAQAIAAMAYGTGTIRRVEKIVGPGNIYVTAAKMLVSWDVSIDMPAGPSEVMIYAEGVQRADWVALDVLAQAEHDPRARAIVVTANRVFAEALKAEVERMAVGSPRREILERSLQNAAILVVADRQEAIKAINMMAPEHLQIVGDDLEEMVAQVRNAGAVFIGETTPVALGDYSVGTNHVLPTMGWAKRASPLSVRDFLRTREYIRCTKEGLGSIANDAVIIATAEGLLNHARSVSARLDGGQC
ncbi:MAG TPA: histidinol dehydrogenase [Candidatus Methanomethylicus sp.]|nr:histidinol dehydrogenase [Candidatus Methanomethylicus sp.]